MTNDNAGVYSGGRELTAEEALTHNVRPRFTSRRPDSKPQPPVYRTGRLWTRDEMVSLFRWDWGTSINAADVDGFVKQHFSGRWGVEPTDHIPFPPMPELPDDGRERARVIRDHEEQRSNTKRSRELFDIDGLPCYVPQHEWPSSNDNPAEQRRKREKIEGLR